MSQSRLRLPGQAARLFSAPGRPRKHYRQGSTIRTSSIGQEFSSEMGKLPSRLPARLQLPTPADRTRQMFIGWVLQQQDPQDLLWWCARAVQDSVPVGWIADEDSWPQDMDSETGSDGLESFDIEVIIRTAEDYIPLPIMLTLNIAVLFLLVAWCKKMLKRSFARRKRGSLPRPHAAAVCPAAIVEVRQREEGPQGKKSASSGSWMHGILSRWASGTTAVVLRKAAASRPSCSQGTLQPAPAQAPRRPRSLGSRCRGRRQSSGGRNGEGSSPGKTQDNSGALVAAGGRSQRSRSRAQVPSVSVVEEAGQEGVGRVDNVEVAPVPLTPAGKQEGEVVTQPGCLDMLGPRKAAEETAVPAIANGTAASSPAETGPAMLSWSQAEHADGPLPFEAASPTATPMGASAAGASGCCSSCCSPCCSQPPLPMGPRTPPSAPPQQLLGFSWAVGSESNRWEGDWECVLCWDAPRETVLAPCGHLGLCLPCTLGLFAQEGSGQVLCPICRAPAASYVSKVYYA